MMLTDINQNHQTKKKPDNKPIIMCIGVGGGGSNVVNYMYQRGIKDVTLIVTNTDQQALSESQIPLKLQLGPSTTHGLGAGANPEIGTSAAIESKEEINKMLTKHIKMVFITAGMGGGTGTGAAPIIASMAKEKGMLVIGVVTTPFMFEGTKKQQSAEEGIRLLEEHCDTLIIIENERLMKQSSDMQVLSLRAAFEKVDKVLYEAVTSITDPINEPGVINVDFCDINTMLRNAGNAVMGTGFAEGEGRGMKAIQQAVDSPLLRHDNIKGSTRLLLSVASGLEGELTLEELAQITNYLKEILENDDIMVIWGHSYEKKLGNKVRISLIASGFPEIQPSKKKPSAPKPPTSTYPNNIAAARLVNRINDPTKSPLPKDNNLTQTVVGQPQEKVLAKKIEIWHQNAKNYVQHIEPGDDNNFTDKEVKEMLSVPTYKRRNISFSYKPNSQEAPIRHHLNNKETAEKIH